MKPRIPALLRHTVLLAAVLAASASPAALRLAPMFSEHMVLQEGRKVPVWGWADDGTAVAVTIQGRTVSTVARGGQWRVDLKPLKAGGPMTLTVGTKDETVQFTDVLVGEVWVCSGQSNMEWPLERSVEPAADIASATNPQIRFFKVPKSRLPEPTTEIKSAWEVCSPDAAKGFSAVGYYFGRALAAAHGKPVGLVGTYWGGTPAESWTCQGALAAVPRLEREIVQPWTARKAGYEQQLAAYNERKAKAREENREFKEQPPRAPWAPAELYNGMIAPLLPYAIQGAIWYQGESNAGQADQYRTLFPTMIQCWRKDWGQGDFPFLAVQLAPWDRNKKRSLAEITAAPGESDWAELREAQLLATRTLPKVGMAVITDVGDKDDIHPTKKGPVGERLALLARALAHGERVVHSGPAYRGIRVKDGKAILSFEHSAGGLVAQGGALTGFAICGEDRQWRWAQAEIQKGDTVAVWSAEVPKPVAVRYGWADFPVVNLFNKAGLPASPFRTDDFPLTTAPKQ